MHALPQNEVTNTVDAVSEGTHMSSVYAPLILWWASLSASSLPNLD